MSIKSKAELRSMASPAMSTAAPLPNSVAGSSLSVTDVQDAIGMQVGKLNLGVLGNFRAERHRRKAEGAMQRELTTHQVNRATELLREKIDGEVEILRMIFKQDFSDRIAALAENAAASQTLVIRKLKAVEAEARKYLFTDIKRELDELQKLLEDQVIDEDDFQKEAAFRLESYEKLKQLFVEMFDGYRAAVLNAYQPSGR